MFDKDVVALDINEENITILIGHKHNIREGATFKTPKGSFENDNIVDLNPILEVIEPFVSKKKKAAKDIMFSIKGQDIIIRHLTVPNTEEKLMRENVHFELRQFIGEKIEEYYSDFEIISFDSENKTDANVMVVGVKKEKIDNYLNLAKELDLNVKAIDIFANNIGRVFKAFKTSFSQSVKLAGVLSIEGHSNSMVITEFGKIVIEKYQGYGLYGANEEEIKNEHEYNKFLDSVILNKELDEENERKYDRFFKSLITQYKLLIQFYSTGKLKKNLDKIYLIGSANRIDGVHEYLERNFEVKVGEIPDFNDLKIVVKRPGHVELKNYLYTYGLLLRRG